MKHCGGLLQLANLAEFIDKQLEMVMI